MQPPSNSTPTCAAPTTLREEKTQGGFALAASEVLQKQMDELDKLGRNVRWFVNEDGTEAVALGYGFVWVVAEHRGQVARYQAYMGELCNGIKQAGTVR